MPPPGYVTCQPINTTSDEPEEIRKDDLNALLYIVVTLLFYSMGIIIGIITYLKREQAEMEEDKMFDLYLAIKREPFNIHKQEKVQQMAAYLRQLEEMKEAREKITSWAADSAHDDRHRHQHHHHHHHDRPYSPGEEADLKISRDTGRHSGGHGEVAPLALQEIELTEPQGAPALLCSLTLAVCEPLLTSEGERTIQTQKDSRPCCFSADGKDKNEIVTKQGEEDCQRVGNTCAPIASVLDDKNLAMPEARQFDYKEVKSLFQKQDLLDGTSTIITNDASPSNESQGIATGDAKKKALLTFDAPSKHVYQVSEDTQRSDDSPSTPRNVLAGGEISSGKNSGDKGSLLGEQAFSLKENVYPSAVARDESSVPNNESDLYKTEDQTPPFITAALDSVAPSHNEIRPASVDVRPKVFSAQAVMSPVSKPKVFTLSPTVDDTSRGSSRPKHQLPRSDSGRSDRPDSHPPKRLASATPDVEGSQGRARRQASRAGPVREGERRGALLFTQKSLHHIGNDGAGVGASAPSRKQSRQGGVLPRQESMDSYHSRQSGSPVLDPDLEWAAISLRPAGEQSGGSLEAAGVTSPPAAASSNQGRHQRKIPRLSRSHAVDNLKNQSMQ